MMSLTPLRPRERRLERQAPPVDFGFRGGNIAAQHPALARSLDAHRDQDRAIDDPALEPHLLVAGVQKEVGHLAQRAFPPGLEPFVEFGRSAAHLGGRERNLRPQQPLQHLDHPPGGDPLDVHLGQRQVDCLVRAGTFFESRGIKLTGTHLRHLKGHFTQAGEHGLGLEAIGVIAPGFSALVRTGAEKLASLDLGRFIDEDARAARPRHPARVQATPHRPPPEHSFRLASPWGLYSFRDVMASDLPLHRPGRYG